MTRSRRGILTGVGLAALAAIGGAVIHSAMTDDSTKEDRLRAERLAEQIGKLRPLHRKLSPPRPGDWRAGPGRDEKGQTFAQYLQCRPARPVGGRRVLYIQPLGEFTKARRRIIDLTAEYMGVYFGLPVKVQPDLPLSVIPRRARRVHPTWGVPQVLSTYVLDELLAPKLPSDAAALIAFTTSDLWPGEGWNFVFGQASLRKRVGVWSIYRNGDLTGGAGAFRACLLRTVKTATHETGHMFSMEHCTACECNLCGSNSREESDRRPLTCCPECVAKVCWATRSDLLERYRKLLPLARKHGFAAEAATYEKSIRTLAAPAATSAPSEPGPGSGV